ncbi:sigma 54 modulation/S30EA ribosomal C-terminal domain-containing protein [Nonomuraea pusilla]|uniref:sigma 54 modulation/S30EA ribosomal C-terminal domain-containing protein n=1 Tax=Nonomuraea pusilla TaxID=46177 RepID=UPI003323F7EE
MSHRPIALEPAAVDVEVRGGIRPADVRHAKETVAALTRLAHEPVLRATVKLVASPHPGERRTAQAVLDVRGRLIHAQATAESTRKAVHLLNDRLRARLLKTTRDWENLRGRELRDGEPGRRHPAPPEEPLPHRPRREDPMIVRRKTYALERAIPDEAVFDMEQSDYDFHLFTEAATGQDSVVYRAGPRSRGDGYRMAQLDPRPGLLGPVRAALTVSPVPAPVLTEQEAVERLEFTGRPFVFYADAATGRGCVLYHRYDGHYGLITPTPA